MREAEKGREDKEEGGGGKGGYRGGGGEGRRLQGGTMDKAEHLFGQTSIQAGWTDQRKKEQTN